MSETKFSSLNKWIWETDVWKRLPGDLRTLFKYIIRLGFKEEPDYDYLLRTLTYIKNKALRNEGLEPSNGTTGLTKNNNELMDLESSKVVSKINYISIQSHVKIFGVEANINTMSNLQQNKTLNSVNFTNWSKWPVNSILGESIGEDSILGDPK